MDQTVIPAPDQVALTAPALLDDLKSGGELFAKLFAADAESADLADPPITPDAPNLLLQSGVDVVEELLLDFSPDRATVYTPHPTTLREAFDALPWKAASAAGV